jgi:hypothetical protein
MSVSQSDCSKNDESKLRKRIKKGISKRLKIVPKIKLKSSRKLNRKYENQILQEN